MLRKISRLRKNNLTKTSRLRKIILAEWVQINPSDPETIQQLTDAMTYGNPVQINYTGSGWRTIQPYGWNTSKEGNVLLMCYKDTGEVRSYRMDKIEDIYIDLNSYGPAVNNNPEMNYENDLDMLVQNLNGDNDASVYIEDNYPDDMPPIPTEENNEIGQGIYDEELQMLENDNLNNSMNIDSFDQNIDNQNIDNQNIDNFENNIEEEDENGKNDI